MQSQACLMLCKDGLASALQRFSQLLYISSRHIFQGSKGLAGCIQLIVSDRAHQV
jgi:hypothetical protein